MLPGFSMARKSALIILFVIAGCSKQAEEPATDEWPKHGLTEAQANQVLAKIGDRTITVGEFADRLASQSPYLQARFESPERRREFLDNLVRYELLVYEAKRRGYMDDPEVQRARRRVMIQELIEQEVDEPLEDQPISDEEVQAAYEANPTEFDRPEQVRASHIFVTDRTKAQAILKEARGADRPTFSRLAREHSEDLKTKAKSGDLQFFTADGDGQPSAALRKAAFSIEQVGKVYPELVEDGGGYHIVMLTAKRAELKRTYEQAKRAIRHKLTRERKEAAMEALTERLRKEVPVEIDYAALDQVKVEVPELPKAP
jgi:peptidyl-prolyl cis-trans isomerase C